MCVCVNVHVCRNNDIKYNNIITITVGTRRDDGRFPREDRTRTGKHTRENSVIIHINIYKYILGIWSRGTSGIR